VVRPQAQWHAIDWKRAQREVRRLQMRIAKAVKEARPDKVKTLQWLVTHSFYAKLLAVKRVTSNKGRKTPGRVNFIRYADDFIVTGKSKRILETMVKPAIEKFLAKRGLTLSEEKTAITHIRDGFTFLGQSLRKHRKTLHITPAKEGVQLLVCKIGTLTRKYRSAPIVVLIKKLNEVLRGWANYHRHVVSTRAFGYVDTYVFQQLWRMLRRIHSKMSNGWLGWPSGTGPTPGKSMYSLL
jgi:hypothetical protein